MHANCTYTRAADTNVKERALYAQVFYYLYMRRISVYTVEYVYIIYMTISYIINTLLVWWCVSMCFLCVCSSVRLSLSLCVVLVVLYTSLLPMPLSLSPPSLPSSLLSRRHKTRAGSSALAAALASVLANNNTLGTQAAHCSYPAEPIAFP